MSEDTVDTRIGQPKPGVDWERIEREYRAGMRSLRAIGEDYNVTEAAIRKRAKRDGWTRDIGEKIQAKAQEKVREATLSEMGSQFASGTEAETIEGYATVVSQVDTRHRRIVKSAMDNATTALEELVALADPKFRDALEALVKEYDQSGPTPGGGWKSDKKAELYRYIIGLEGRVKIGKELAATHGVYIPMERKIFRLDDQSNKTTEVEAMLEQLGRAQ